MHHCELVEKALVVPALPKGAGTFAGGVLRRRGEYVSTSGLVRNGQPIVSEPAPLCRSAEPRALRGEMIFAGFIFGHYGHFLLESCARLWYARDRPDLPLVWLLARQFNAWQSEILDVLGITNQHIFVMEPSRVRRLHVPAVGYEVQRTFHPVHAAFMAAFDTPQGGAPRRKIWLSRSALKDGQSRVPTEPLVERRLSDAGWSILQPETKSVAEQLAALSGAAHVAGFLGSAFHTLMLLKRPPQKVTIFLRGPNPNHNYETIATACGFDQQLLQAGLRPGIPRGFRTNFSLRNPSIILEALAIPRRRTAEATSPTPHARRINLLLEASKHKRYLEVGVGEGRTFLNVAADLRVGVEPELPFDARHVEAEGVELYETSSDEYFAVHTQGRGFDVVFIDGDPSFEQVFRDLCASLPHGHRRSLWIIAGTTPPDGGTAPSGGRADTYKVVFALRDYFPTLSYATIEGAGAATFVWYEPRREFAPAVGAMGAIAALTPAEAAARREVFNVAEEADLLDRLRRFLAG